MEARSGDVAVVAAELETRPETDRYLLPDVTLSRGRFLDGTTAAQLPRTVEIVSTDGIRGISTPTRGRRSATWTRSTAG